MPGFAVIEIETTGLFPGGHDRVIEVAVVHVDPHGRISGAVVGEQHLRSMLDA
jgi:DNA polymerase-3 subunit epsilon